jgi:hypothetical protein
MNQRLCLKGTEKVVVSAPHSGFAETRSGFLNCSRGEAIVRRENLKDSIGHRVSIPERHEQPVFTRRHDFARSCFDVPGDGDGPHAHTLDRHHSEWLDATRYQNCVCPGGALEDHGSWHATWSEDPVSMGKRLNARSESWFDPPVPEELSVKPTGYEFGPEVEHVIGSLERLIASQEEEVWIPLMARPRRYVLRKYRAVVENVDFLGRVKLGAKLASNDVGNRHDGVERRLCSCRWPPILARGVMNDKHALRAVWNVW